MIKTINHKIMLIITFLITSNVFAKTISFRENAYLVQAPKEIENISDKVAEKMNFKDIYEIAVPKKSGIQINPWNKFAVYGINPQTKHPLIVINPEWFLQIPQKQQEFLLTRFFMFFKNGMVPLSDNIITMLFVFLTIFLLLVTYLVLGRTQLKSKKWARTAVAFSIVAICNIIFINNIQIKILQSFRHKYGVKINEMVVKQTLDKTSAIKALEFFDYSIKEDLKNGEKFWLPYEKSFEDYANELKK